MSLFRTKTETESGGFFPGNSFSSFNNNNSIIGIFFFIETLPNSRYFINSSRRLSRKQPQ